MIQVEVKGVRDLMRALDPGRIIGPPLRAYLTAGILRVEEEAKPLIPRDTGYLARSLQSSVQDTEATLRTNAPHALYVHGPMDGRRKRTRPHWPPIAAITPWARRHGMDPYLVARSIARKGTPLVPFLTLAVRQARPYLRQLQSLARAIERKAAS